ncbi:MAG: HindVP family restriction endonuclease [Oscillospiraceae bacterium]|nr:HindVP family restriction endonuclease [Oscillospiraceae bacterium]
MGRLDMEINNPRLFGINNSNRNFSDKDTWGKNIFNATLPISLSCYMYHNNMRAIYITADGDLNSNISYKGFDEILNIEPLDTNTFYAFETPYTPYQKYVVGPMPRNDITIINLSNDACVSTFEIKLTALPDSTTYELSEDQYGIELVVRPDTIIYLACSFIELFGGDTTTIGKIVGNGCDDIADWSEAREVLPYIHDINSSIRQIAHEKHEYQTPIILNPIWKTIGNSSQLSEYCLDVFIWSNIGILNLFLPEQNTHIKSITRHIRSCIWLYKMLLDYSKHGHFDGKSIYSELTYNTKNDKAFATAGNKTHKYMDCEELTKPRIRKEEIKDIILGGGQQLLSPERRFDAIIVNSPDLF